MDHVGCDWHTVMDAVVVYGQPLIDNPDRFGAVTAVGLDETLFARDSGGSPSCCESPFPFSRLSDTRPLLCAS